MVVHRLPKKDWGFDWEFVAKKTNIDWEKLYKWIWDYLDYEGWKDIQIDSDKYEVFYQDITLPNGAKNQWLWFRAYKEPKVKSGGYIRLYFALEIQTLYVKDKEFMHKGKKITLQNGEFKFVGHVFYSENQDLGTRKKSEWDTNSFLSFWKRRFWWIANKGVIKAAKNEVIHYNDEIYNFLQEYTGVKPPTEVREYHALIRGVEH